MREPVMLNSSVPIYDAYQIIDDLKSGCQQRLHSRIPIATPSDHGRFSLSSHVTKVGSKIQRAQGCYCIIASNLAWGFDDP